MRPAAAEIAIVGDERAAVVRERRFDHRMTAALDDEVETGIDLRPHIIALDRECGQRGGDIDHGKRFGCRLDLCARGRDGCGEALEDFEFQPERAVGRIGDLGLKLAELRRGEAHLAGERLAMDEAGVERRSEQLLAVLRRDVDEIAEHVVVPDLQRADAGRLGVAHLQRGDDAARFVAQRARLVERALAARAHEAAVALERRQFVGECAGKLGRDGRIGPPQCGRRLRDLVRHDRKRREPCRKLGRGRDAVADAGEIARPAAADDKPRQRAGEIGRRLEPLAHFGAQAAVAREHRDGVEPARDLLRIGERRGEPLRQQPRAGRRHGAVDGGQQRAAPLARERADQFEIGARRLVDRERRAGGLAQRRRQRRPLADLRALHIGDDRGCRSQLDARQRAERRGGGDAEERREPPLGRRAVEHVARERRHGWQRAEVRRKLGIRIERVGDDDFAGLEPRDLGGERAAVALEQAEFGRGNVDPGEREAAVVVGRGGARPRDGEEKIVAPRVEQRILGQRAGRHQPHHVAAHHALVAALARLGRVFKLLAHGDAMAERDELMQIFVGALDRHAAHRNVAAHVLAALGQHDAECARGDFGVVEEHFVEVAHPVEQQAIRIGGLDLDILLHHRGYAADVVGRFGGDAAGLDRRAGIVGHDGARGIHGGAR